MKLSEKLFLWFSTMISVILAVILLLAGLQKQGLLGFAADMTAQEVWQSIEDQWKDWTDPAAAEDPELRQQEETRPQEPVTEELKETQQTETQALETKTQETTAEERPEETETETLPPAVIDMSDMETEAAEADPYPYYIKVNKKQNCITIYEKDEAGEYTVPVKAMICSTGYATPLGTYGSKGKYVMKGLIHGVFGQYSTWITGNILFHSVPSARATKDSVSVRNYNQLGTTASAGCVRLTVADAKWIYDNCEIGTLIEIYEEDDPGPLGKPEAIKLPEGSGWDPTDPDPENPWHEHEPSITVAEEIILYYGEEWKPREDMTALDTCGNDITDKVEIMGDVDCYEPGRYRVEFSVTDAVGKTAAAGCEYLVIPVPYPGTEEQE